MSGPIMASSNLISDSIILSENITISGDLIIVE